MSQDQTGRETVANWMLLRGYATGHGDTIQDLLFEMEGQLGGPKTPPAGKGDIDIAIRAGLSKFGLSMAWEVREAIADAVLEMLRSTDDRTEGSHSQQVA